MEPLYPLFDLTGLGFSSKNKKIVRPVVPEIKIAVNGQAVDLPSTPVRSTNANGLVGYNLYQASYKVPSSATGIPTVTASSDNKNVKVTVKQAESASGTATVVFDYNGMVKTYHVVLSRNS